MKKDLKLIIGVFAIGFATMVSCKKSTSSSPASNLEGGSWTLSKEYLDTNNNGIMDANEQFTDTSYANTKLNFNADGTLIETYYAQVRQGSWLFENSNTYLKVKDTGAGSPTTHLLIVTLTANSLVLKDTSNAAHGGTNWEYFTK